LKRLLIGGGIAILIVTSLLAGYYLYAQPQSYTQLPTEQIEFGGITLTVELATTPAQQGQGLSDRDSMSANHGMLFVFTQEGEWSFWMHEMRFPLDIIWFNSARQVIFIEQGLPPCTQSSCPVYTPPANALYVLEVNAGFVSAHDVTLGESFSFV
jgi:uncharacterized membrane protein (UPF0127 family)